MFRPKWRVVALLLPALAAFAAAISCELDARNHASRAAGLTPLEVPLTPTSDSTLRRTFTTGWSALHEVELLFPGNVDAKVVALLEPIVSFNDAHQFFDADWRVFEAGKEVGRGSGREPLSSISGTSQSRGFGFGKFPALAGHTYEIEFRRGPGFGVLLTASPVMAVSVGEAGPSIGLAWSAGLGRPMAFIFVVIGLGLSLGAVFVARV